MKQPTRVEAHSRTQDVIAQIRGIRDNDPGLSRRTCTLLVDVLRDLEKIREALSEGEQA